jgi:hypothetical protein
MATTQQIRANRINARKWWVKTPEGKLKVSKNAVKHWITAHRIISDDERKTFDLVCRQVINDLDPEGYIETMLCERIALYQTKLLRIVQLESIQVEVAKIRSETDALDAREHRDSTDKLFGSINLWAEEWTSEFHKIVRNKINFLKDQIDSITSKYLSVQMMDVFEQLQRYEAITESRMLKIIKELQYIQEKRQKRDHIETVV